MALLFVTMTVFMLAFSILWMTDQSRYDYVNERISITFKHSHFPDQKTNERDRIFKLFPLKPAPILFKKLGISELLLSDLTLYRSTKYVGSLLIASLFGFAIASLAINEQTLHRMDILTLELALFGLVFFFTRNSNTQGTIEYTDMLAAGPKAEEKEGESNPKARTFSGFGIFFVVFALLIPLLLWLIDPTVLTAGQTARAPGGPANVGGTENLPGNEDPRLGFAFQFLGVVALCIPIFLFLFDIAEAKRSIEKDIFEDQDVGLSSITRVKNIAAVLASIVCALVALNVDLSGLSLFSGLALAGLSVAMRESITNFFSGLQMSWDGSLKVGDVISIPEAISSDTGSTYGIVRDIRSRYTVIEDRNTVRRLVPNFQLVSQTIEHWTHEDRSIRLSLRIGIPYIKEPRMVRTAQRIMESVCYDVPRVLTHKPPNALLVRYDDSQLTFSLRFWIDDAQNGIRPVISEVLISLYERLSEAGIKIPFPQQDIHIKELPPGFGVFTGNADSGPPTDTQGGSDGKE